MGVDSAMGAVFDGADISYATVTKAAATLTRSKILDASFKRHRILYYTP